jgi:hypothetical protein
LVSIAVLYTTKERAVVKNYVIALWVVDITHIIITAYGVGVEKSLDIPRWNAMTWGNLGVTVRPFFGYTTHTADNNT